MRNSKIKFLSDSAFFLALIMTLLVLAAAFAAPFASAAYRKNVLKTIVIDAGHGGIDGGVVGVRTGVFESDLNLKIAKIVGEYLESAGFRVVFTRTNKHGLYTDLPNKTKKREDMEKRAAIIQRAEPAAVVSVHMNYYTSSNRRGAQVFFAKSNEESRRFGDIMQDRFNTDFNMPAIGRKYSALSAEKYILECTSAPVIICECGFLSNPIDEANLIDPDYQAALGYAIFQGIVIFLSNEA